MDVAAALHHTSRQRAATTAAATQTMSFAPDPADASYTATSMTNSIADFLEPLPVIEHATPAPVDDCTVPPRMIEHGAPSPVIDHIAPPSAATGVFTGFENQQFPVLPVEAAASQVVGSFSSGVERVQEYTVEQIVYVPAPQIHGHIEESAQVDELVPPIVEGSFPSVGESASLVYNQAHQELIAAEQESSERATAHL